MKKCYGKGHIKTLILLLIIIALTILGLYLIQQQYQKAKLQTIKTNMSLIELKAKEYIHKQKTEGKEISYLGTKLSEWQENNLKDDMKNHSVISEEEQEKYFVLSEEDLEQLNVGFGNEKDAYYLINYETSEVVISSGYKVKKDTILYKLSELIEQE